MRWLGLLVMLCCAGCASLRARRYNDVRSGYTTVSGLVRVKAGAPAGDRWVVLYKKGRRGWVRYSVLGFLDARRFDYLCRAGEYRLVAFVDVDGDRRLGVSEPRVELPSIEVNAGRPVWGLLAELGADVTPVSSPVELPDAEETWARHLIYEHVGDLAKLDDTRLGEEAGELGYLNTAAFLKRYGLGVSFLQPYDPTKTPVVFVHGARGHPSEFSQLIDGLDRQRFQPWVVSYPSGASLTYASEMLQRVLELLQRQLHFNALHVVAHSMGGLVARDAVAQLPGRWVTSLVTFSTPWGGGARANLGLQAAPTVVSSWADIAAGSDFIDAALDRPLLPRHYLFFSFEGGSGTDGVVELKSQLAPEVQQQATRVYGLAATHTSILRSPEAAALLNEVLLESE